MHLLLFAVMCVSLHFGKSLGKDLWQEHAAFLARAVGKNTKKAQHTASNAAATTAHEVTGPAACICNSLRQCACHCFLARTCWQEFGKNTKKAHSEQCSRNNSTRSQMAAANNKAAANTSTRKLHGRLSFLRPHNAGTGRGPKAPPAELLLSMTCCHK